MTGEPDLTSSSAGEGWTVEDGEEEEEMAGIDSEPKY